MDPWANTSINTPTPAEQAGAEPVELLLRFENSFISDSSDFFDAASLDPTQIHKIPGSFERLPDSEEYLSKLEARLGKLRAGSNLAKGKAVGGKRKEEEELVLELRAAKEAALVQLVNRGEEQGGTGGRSEEEISGEREVTTNYIARRLQPVQPVTEGEVVVLTKSDSLAVNQEEGEEGDHSEEVCEN